MNDIVAINALRKSFGHLEILKGINLNVKSGEAVVMIGGSGSGKSTCLRCINRLEEPTSGTVNVAGMEITMKGVDLNLVRQNIGMVFQGINLYPHMTALENVTLALRKVKKMSRVEADECGQMHLAQVGLSERMQHYPNQLSGGQQQRVGLGDRMDHKPTELSGGQQQRVGIARALALEPKVMLFDEPTSGLDPELVGEVLNVMSKTKVAGMTMIVVTHEMQFAREMGDRVVFMEKGEILDQGTPEEILIKPRHKRIQDFLSRLQ